MKNRRTIASAYRLVCGLALLAAPFPMAAGTLTSFDMPLSLEISSGLAFRSGTSDNSRPFVVLTSTVGNYSVTAEACMEGWCGGTGVDGQIDTPVRLKLTNLVATCQISAGSCGPIEFFLSWGAEAPSAPGYADQFKPILIFLSGSSDAPFTGSLEIEASGKNTVSSTMLLTSGGGAFSFPGSTAPLFIEDRSGIFSISADLTIDSLPKGASFRLPNSLDITVGAAEAVPEPASLLLVGLALVFLVRRSLNATPSQSN